MRCLLLYILILVTSVNCTSKSESQLTKALKGAVKEKKVTEKKMQSILAEYDKLRDEDKSKASEYAEQVLSAIEMGGDSSHIDAARKQVMKSKKIETRV